MLVVRLILILVMGLIYSMSTLFLIPNEKIAIIASFAGAMATIIAVDHYTLGRH